MAVIMVQARAPLKAPLERLAPDEGLLQGQKGPSGKASRIRVATAHVPGAVVDASG